MAEFKIILLSLLFIFKASLISATEDHRIDYKLCEKESYRVYTEKRSDEQKTEYRKIFGKDRKLTDRLFFKKLIMRKINSEQSDLKHAVIENIFLYLGIILVCALIFSVMILSGIPVWLILGALLALFLIVNFIIFIVSVDSASQVFKYA